MKSEFGSSYPRHLRFAKAEPLAADRSFERETPTKMMNKSMLSNSPAYYQKIPDDIKDASQVSEGSSRMYSSNFLDTSSRIVKDPKRGVLKARGNEALKDVIVSQREKLDYYQKNEKYLKDELKAREDHIITLQKEN